MTDASADGGSGSLPSRRPPDGVRLRPDALVVAGQRPGAERGLEAEILGTCQEAPLPLVVLARRLGRSIDEIRPAVERMVDAGVLEARLPDPAVDRRVLERLERGVEDL